jgi:hypothetical protein
VATGPVRAPPVPATRTAEDFAAPRATAVATDPEAGGSCVADNRTLPGAEAFVRYVAQACGGSRKAAAKKGSVAC